MHQREEIERELAGKRDLYEESYYMTLGKLHGYDRGTEVHAGQLMLADVNEDAACSPAEYRMFYAAGYGWGFGLARGVDK